VSESRPGRGLDRDLLRAAEQELADIQRAEQAWLLCQAAALRGTLMEPAALLALPLFLPDSVAAWRTRARVVVDLLAAEEDRGPHPAVATGETRAGRQLEELVDVPIGRWPTPGELARIAFEHHPEERTRLALGAAYLAEDQPELALDCFGDLLRGELAPRWRASALEGLAAAQARLGRARLALGAFDEAADEPGSSPLALVGALYFALCLDEAGRARRAAARLDLLIDPTRPTFRAALARLRRFVDIVGACAGEGRSGGRDDDGLMAALAESPGSAAGRVWATLH
jgi:tetratricopeptide (TPR) repeat protein